MSHLRSLLICVFIILSMPSLFGQEKIRVYSPDELNRFRQVSTLLESIVPEWPEGYEAVIRDCSNLEAWAAKDEQGKFTGSVASNTASITSLL